MSITNALFLIALGISTAWANTTVLFSTGNSDLQTSAYAEGPFPTNSLALPDGSTPTGLRVDLPVEENSCTFGFGAACSNNALLNQIDGFSVNPRVMVCFSGPVSVGTLPGAINLVRVKGPQTSAQTNGVVPLKQLILDPNTNCVFGKPNHVLDQQTVYLLTVAGSIKDSPGNNPIGADPAYARCLAARVGSYCEQLSDALDSAHLAGSVVAASLFTTMSVTNWLEGSRRFVDASFSQSLPAGFPWTFRLQNLQSITWYPAQSALGPQEIPLSALQGVDSIAFGLLLSPNYLNTSGPAAGTITAGPNSPNAYSLVSYHIFLPPAPKKGDKIPLVVYGHGLGDSQFGAPTFIASTLAKNGFATLAFEVTGHGFGSKSVVQVTSKNGSIATELTPGRGVQLIPGQPIGSTDGCIAPGPFGIRDCSRQSAVDLFALVHAIQDLGGLGLNLDSKRIYYIGQSLGSEFGTLFMAVEPSVRTAVLSGAGGTDVEVARLGITGRPLATEYLASITQDPLLLNVLYNKAPPEPYYHDAFNDNYVFRGNPPVVNTVPGAMADQAAFEAAEWIGMSGDPLAFASHLHTSPLAGAPSKQVLFQFGIGDLEVPNPTESAVVQAADRESATTLFQFPLAVSLQPELALVIDPAFPRLPILPHRSLSNPTIFTPGNEAERSIALAEQQQAADFLTSNGAAITDPDLYLTAPFNSESGLFINKPATVTNQLNFVQIKP